MSLVHPVHRSSTPRERGCRAAGGVSPLLGRDHWLINVTTLWSEPRDCTRLLPSWCRVATRPASVDETLNRHLAHADSGSRDCARQDTGGASLDAHLSTKTRASEESGDCSTPHSMASGTASRAGERMARGVC